MANKWLEALKSKSGQHNTTTILREGHHGPTSATGEIEETRENHTDNTDKIASSYKVDSPVPSKNGHTPKKRTDNTDKITPKPKKRTEKLTPEEEEAHRSVIAKAFPAYIYTEDRARECLARAKTVPEASLDIETYGRLKRDGLLYTRCKVRMILLHHASTSWFIDSDHVPEDLVVRILETLKDKPKFLHNALFDIPRLYRRFGVLLDRNIHDTLIAARATRASGRERRAGWFKSRTPSTIV